MRNAHPRYMCFPSVVRVGVETTITVFPRDTSRYFRPDRQYEIGILHMEDNNYSYHTPLMLDHPFTIENGCLVFKHTFEEECEYAVRLLVDGVGPEISVPLYAVKDDLYNLRPLKGDLHTHSYYSDGQDGLTMTPADYREEGFDFFSLTDHNRMYTSEMIRKLYQDVPLGMHLMIGEEVHTPGSTLHIVHVGGNSSVALQYIQNIDKYEGEVAEIEATLGHIPENHRNRAARAKWACDKIHEAGGLAIFAHPYWQPKNYNVSEEFSNILFDMGIFDAFELMGGLNIKSNNLQLALWQQQLMKGINIPVVGSSDSHNHDINTGKFAKRFTIAFAKENDTESILSAIRAGYTAVGEEPTHGQDEVRFYGSLRLVAFAHFLYQNYFNETWRLCVGEGILMRRYAQGEDVSAQLAAAEDTVENFYRQFYGLTPAPVLSEGQLAFLTECLQLQRTLGPKTKGSAIIPNGTNGNRE